MFKVFSRCAWLKIPPPPIPHLLESNAPPSDAEALLVHKTIEEVENDISDLKKLLCANMDDGSLSSNDRTELKIQLQKASEFVGKQKGIISVLRRGIPPEILHEIFSYILPSPCLDRPHARVIGSHVPSHVPFYVAAHNKAVLDLWALAQVCQLWRTSALCMPSFCGHLPVAVIKTENKPYTKRHFRIFTGILHRSGNAPLNVFIHFPAGTGNLRDPIVDLLVGCSTRWKQAVIALDVSFLQFHFQSLKGRVPLLQSLTMVATSNVFNNIQFDMFEVAPLLNRVCFRGHKNLLPLLQLPKSQLLYLDEHCEHSVRLGIHLNLPMENRQKFEVPQNLKTLVIGMGRLPYALIKGKPPQLNKLYIKRCYRDPAQTPNEILSWISTFTMKELYIDGRDARSNEATPYSLAWILNILPDHHTLLTNLSLRVLFPDNDFQFRLALLLDYTPALARLDISLPSAADIIRLAAISPSGDVCVPHLEICNFYIEEKYTLQSKITALTTLGSSRCKNRGLYIPYNKSGRPIQSLGVYFAWSKTKSVDEINFDGSLRRQELNLEHWYITREFSQLENFVQSLCNEIPELRGQKPPRSRLFNWGPWAEGVHEILRNINNHTVGRIQDVYLSEVHLVLKKISDGYVVRDDKYHFSDRAQQILDKWRPLFEANLKDRRWIARKNSSLVYLSADDPLRSSPGYFDAVVYGTKANIPSGPISEIWSELLNL